MAGSLKNKTTQQLRVSSLRLLAIITAVSGVMPITASPDQFAGFSELYYGLPLIPVIISFLVIATSGTKLAQSNYYILTHLLMLSVIVPSAVLIYIIPSMVKVELLVIALLTLIVSFGIGWKPVNQLIAIIYSLVAVAVVFSLNQELSSFIPYSGNLIIFIVLTAVSYFTATLRSEIQTGEGIERASTTKSEDKLKPAETDIYRMIFENSSDGIYRTTLDGKFIIANQALAKLLGYQSVKELLNLDIIKNLYVDPEDRDRLVKILHAQKRVKNYRVKLRKKDDAEIIVRLNERLAFNDSDEPLYFEGSLQDITSQVETEEERKKELEELREEKKKAVKDVNTAIYTSNIKAQFLASMSHEIKTPINSIVGFLTLIEKGMFESEDELKDFAANAKTAADSLLDIINSVLDISKLEAGKMELDEVEFDIRTEVGKSKSIIKPTAQEKNLKLNFSISDEVPEKLYGDPTRFRQILVNILSNAVKYTDKGEVSLQIDVTHKTEATTKLKVKVIDTGRGIPKEKLPLLFKPYTQLKDKKWSKKEGSGLGLMICKEFVKLMGGDIEITSDEGQGTTVEFTVVLKYNKNFLEDSKTEGVKPEKAKTAEPVTVSETEDRTQPEEKMPDMEFETSDGNSNKRNRLLLVEDNPISQKVEKKLLIDSGYRVKAVSSGFDAIEAVKSNNFDLVLMDIEMPEMDGLTATQKIRELKPPMNQIPIIAVTAHSSMKDREKCLAAGMDDYIAKPININFMKMTIDTWLTRTYD